MERNIEEIKKFNNRFAKEEIFLKNDYEDAAIHWIPNDGFYVKFKGRKEFKANKGSGVVTDAILQPEEITKQEYNLW